MKERAWGVGEASTSNGESSCCIAGRSLAREVYRLDESGFEEFERERLNSRLDGPCNNPNLLTGKSIEVANRITVSRKLVLCLPMANLDFFFFFDFPDGLILRESRNLFYEVHPHSDMTSCINKTYLVEFFSSSLVLHK